MKKQAEKKKKTDVKNTVGRDNLRRFFRNRAAVVGLILLGVIVFGAIFVSVLSPYSYDEMDLKNRAILFSSEHWLGTDQYGRDMLTRLLYGARVSLFVGFLSVALGCAVGGFLGGIVHSLHVAQQLAVHLVFHKHKDLGVNALTAHPLDLLL